MLIILVNTSKVKISADALRMRCRRLCERKPSGKFNIDASTAEQYKEGGPSREMLEMALLECISKHGVQRSSYKKIKARGAFIWMLNYIVPLYDFHCNHYIFIYIVYAGLFDRAFHQPTLSLFPFQPEHIQADFVTKCKLIKERLESRETDAGEVVHGGRVEESWQMVSQFNSQHSVVLQEVPRNDGEAIDLHPCLICYLFCKCYISFMVDGMLGDISQLHSTNIT